MHKELGPKSLPTTPRPSPPTLPPPPEKAPSIATSHHPPLTAHPLSCVTSATTEYQPVTQTRHPASTHLRNKQEPVNPPQTCPPLTPPGMPLPPPDQRPCFLRGRHLRVESQKAVAPLDVFCRVSFHDAPAKTPPAAPQVFAPLMMTHRRPVESQLTATKEQGRLLQSLKLQAQRQTLVVSGIVEQISLLSKKTTTWVIKVACHGPGWHHGESLVSVVVTAPVAEEAAATPGSPPPSVAAALPSSLVSGDTPGMGMRTLQPALKEHTVTHHIY